MLCKNCGSQLENGSKFCANCGAKVLDVEQVNDEVVNIDDSGSSVQNFAVNDVPNLESNVVFPNSKIIPNLEPGSVMPVSDNGIQVFENDNTVNSGVNGSSKGKKNLVPIVIGIIAVLLIAGGIYFYFFNNKDKVVKNLINNAYDKLDSLFVRTGEDIEDESFLVNGDLIINTNIPKLEDLNGEKISYTFGTDYHNKKMEFGVGLQENGKSIFDITMYLLNNVLYVSFKDDFDKLVKVDIDEYDNIFTSAALGNLSESDIKYLIRVYRDVLIKSLKGKDFDKSSATIVLDGKNTKVNKLSYNLTSERRQQLINDFIYEALNDDMLLEILAKISDSSVDEIRNQLEMSKADGLYDDTGVVTFDIYTKGFGNSFVGMDIQGIVKIRKNSDNVTVEAGMGMEKVTLTIKNISNENLLVELNSNIEGAEFSGSLNLNIKEVTRNNYSGSVVFKLNSDGTELNITSNFTEVFGSNIADSDVTGAVDYEDLSNDDLERLYKNLETKIIDSNLYKIIENYYDLDSSYDF